MAKKKTGLQKVMDFSEELEAITGRTKGSRSDATKWIWDYIKKHKLQDDSDRRIIVADAKFKEFSGKSKLGMMKIAGVLSQHLFEI